MLLNIFCGRTDKIMGAYVTKIVAILSLEYYRIETWIYFRVVNVQLE